MNFTARIKSARAHPQYVLNVSIDIPLKSKYAITHRSQETSMTPSPNKIKKKCKLSITPVQDRRTMNSSNPNTIRDLYLNHRKKCSLVHPQLSRPNNNHSKHKSSEISPRNKPNPQRVGRQSCVVVPKISILEQADDDDEENVIKYTSNSDRVDEDSKLGYRDPAPFHGVNSARGSDYARVLTSSSYINLSEIRSYEEQAIKKKEHLNYEYLKEKILVLASVKKIQRAWRNYTTKKLLKSYSNDIRLKCKQPIDSSDCLLSVRSQGRSLRFKSMHLDKTYAMLERASNMTQKQKETIERIQRIKEESIQKWEYLIQQIRTGKDIDDLLQKSERRRDELKIELGSEKREELSSELERKKTAVSQAKGEGNNEIERRKRVDLVYETMMGVKSDRNINFSRNEDRIRRTKNYYYLKGKQSELHTTPDGLHQVSADLNPTPPDVSLITPNQSRDISEETSLTTKQHARQIEYFESKIQHLYNDISDSSFTSSPNDGLYEMFPSSVLPEQRKDDAVRIESSEQGKGSEQSRQYELETMKLKKKLMMYSQQIEKMQTDSEYIVYHGMTDNSCARMKSIDLFMKKSAETQHGANGFESPRKGFYPPGNESAPTSRYASKANYQSHKVYRFSEEQRNRLASRIMDELFEQYYLVYIELKEQRGRILEAPQKQYGINSSLYSLKDYIQNFANYVNDYEKSLVINSLMQPAGPTPAVLLRFFRGEDVEDEEDNYFVLSIDLFNRHWEYLDELIFFEPKYPDDERKEAERLVHLKQFTKVFFRAIFDGVNYSMESERLFGLMGRPYPWSCSLQGNKKPTLMSAFRFCYARLTKLATICCGNHFDDRENDLPKSLKEEILEENMLKLLQMEMDEEDCRWAFIEDQHAETKYELAVLMEEAIFEEVVKEISAL